MAYKVFTNGSPLPASDLNDYLMKQSVMVFANSTARSAALTAPTEGMVTYLEDTNKVEVYTGSSWTDINDNTAAIPKSTVTTTGDLIVANGNASVTRLGIGSNGQSLLSNGTTAVWGTPAATPSYDSWSSLASGNITTGSATFSITSFSAKDKYLLLVNDISATGQSGSVDVAIRINGDSSNVDTTFIRIEPAATYASTIIKQGIDSFILGKMSSNAGSTLSGGTLINGARSTSAPKLVDFWGAGEASSGTGHTAHVGKGFYTGTSPVTSIDIRLSGVGVTIDAGTYALYGSD